MNLVILDSDGNELALERVSLIRDGMELVVGAALEKSVPVCPAEEPVNETPYAPDVPESAPSVFDTPAKDTIVGGDTIITPEPQPLSGVGVEVDKQGVPWDERIHSSSKKKTAKGVWAKRKNLPEGLHEQITAQLLSGQPQPEPTPVSDERPAPITGAVPEIPAGQQESAVPAVPNGVEQVTTTSAIPEAPVAATPEVPQAPAPLPEGNQIGDSNDSSLSGILSTWGKKS